MNSGKVKGLKEKILLIDDEPEKILIFTTILDHHGFEVVCAGNGREGLEKVASCRPDLILLDINMPDINGHDLRRKLKERPSTRQLPVVMFSSSDAIDDKLKSLHDGADDYITKNVDHRELVARLDALIRRYKEGIGANPLTRLPGNHAIEEDIQRRISSGQPFSVCYADLDHFKAYNDVYGFRQGDEVIRRTAEAILESLHRFGTPDDFVGHIGGDDFIFVLQGYDRCDAVCREIIDRLEKTFPLFYNEEDRARGFIITHNRKNETETFPVISISIAVITNERRSLTSVGQVSQLASEVKKIVKGRPGNQYYIDMRSVHANP